MNAPPNLRNLQGKNRTISLSSSPIGLTSNHNLLDLIAMGRSRPTWGMSLGNWLAKSNGFLSLSIFEMFPNGAYFSLALHRRSYRDQDDSGYILY